MCRFYGLPCQVEGLGGDAHYPDLQEGAESMSAALVGALAGADTMVGFGTLDGAETFSLADAVLDDPKWGTPCYDEAENRLHAQKGVMACIVP